jgi:hypothetical protein
MISVKDLTLAGHFGAENFMSGLKIVFDRDRMVLGWKFFDCKCLRINLDGFLVLTYKSSKLQ